MIDSRELIRIETNLLRAARRVTYPPTPDLASAFRPARVQPRRQIRWSYAVVVILIALASLLAVPEVRAAILEFLQIGAVRIELPTQQPLNIQATPSEVMREDLGSLISIQSLAGETTLEGARANFDYPIPLPAYPDRLGQPDHVFLQTLGPGESFVILAWMDSDQPEEVKLALYVIGPGVSITKGPVQQIETATVGEHPALYIRGSHFLLADGRSDLGVLVLAPALIWEADGVTYRIESGFPLSELVRIAESLEK